MDDFLHYEFDLTAGDVVEVILDRQANVRLMDDANFRLYREGKQFRYHGGLAKESPVLLPAPRPGRWHAVVDLRGFAGTVHASARVLQGAT